MTDNQILYLVISLLYVWECLDFGRESELRFSDPGWGPAVWKRGAVLGPGRSLFWASPFPPLGRLYRAGDWGWAEAKSLRTLDLRERYEALKKSGFWLSVLGNILFVYVFILWPWLVGRFELSAFNIPLLLGVFALNMGSALTYRHVHKKYFPQKAGERTALFLQSLLLPTVGIRLRDRLSRSLAEGIHPLAAAKVLCGEDDFKRLARRAWMEALHPIPEERNPGPRWTQQLEAWFRDQGLDPAELAAPIRTDAASARSYCPRCEVESRLESGSCPDCPGIALRPIK